MKTKSGIITIGEAWKDNEGAYHIKGWSFENGVSPSQEELIKIAGQAGGLQGYCFFCDKPLKQRGVILGTDKLQSFRDLYGNLPNNLAGTIGKRAICTSCASDIRAYSQPDDY